jgi:hypothetical protein
MAKAYQPDGRSDLTSKNDTLQDGVDACGSTSNPPLRLGIEIGRAGGRSGNLRPAASCLAVSTV